VSVTAELLSRARSVSLAGRLASPEKMPFARSRRNLGFSGWNGSRRRCPSSENRKNALSFLIGPETTAEYCWALKSRGSAPLKSRAVRLSPR
jgi:hypothetical protein